MHWKYVLVAASLGFALPAVAQTATVDFTAPIVIDGASMIDDLKCPSHKDAKNPDGAPVRDCDTKLTLGELSYLMLERPAQNQDWTVAVKRDDLARAVRNANAFTLLPDQRTMIEAAIGPYMAPSVVGAVNRMLPPAK